MIHVCGNVYLRFCTLYTLALAAVRIFFRIQNNILKKKKRPELLPYSNINSTYKCGFQSKWLKMLEHFSVELLKPEVYDFIQICIYLTSESLTVTVQMFTLTWLIFAAPDVKSAWVNILAEKGHSSHMLLYRVHTWRGFSYRRPRSGITHEKALSVGTLWGLLCVYVPCALTHSGNQSHLCRDSKV